MKVTVLMENTTPSGRFAARHGLSLLLERVGKRILFDVGPDELGERVGYLYVGSQVEL